MCYILQSGERSRRVKGRRVGSEHGSGPARLGYEGAVSWIRARPGWVRRSGWWTAEDGTGNVGAIERTHGHRRLVVRLYAFRRGNAGERRGYAGRSLLAAVWIRSRQTSSTGAASTFRLRSAVRANGLTNDWHGSSCLVLRATHKGVVSITSSDAKRELMVGVGKGLGLDRKTTG